VFRVAARWSLVVVVLVMGCRNEPLDKELVSAHDRFQKAVSGTDSATLFEMSPAVFRQTMQTRYVEWSKMVQRVEAVYPEALKRDILSRLHVSLLQGVTDGKSLFISLVNLGERRDSEQVSYGLEAVRTHSDGNNGTVTTRAGETFDYVKEDDEWKCLLFQKQFRKNESWNSLIENMKTAAHNLNVWKDSQFESFSTKDPIGQTNVLLYAINQGNHTAVFNILDKPTKALMRKGWLKVKQVRAALAKRVPERKVRQHLLKTKKLSWMLRVRDDLSFFAALWDDGRISKSLSVSLATRVQCTRVEPTGGTIVVIANGVRKPQLCASGTSLLFRPDSKGVQRLASLKNAISKFGLGPIDAKLGGLLKAPTATQPVASEPGAKVP
jgi:hypothetical protein